MNEDLERLPSRRVVAATASPTDLDAVFNPFDPDIHRDPYPAYRRLREQDSIPEVMPGVWLLSRYRDVSALLRNPSVSVDNRKSPLHDAFVQSLPEDMREPQLAPSMLFLDPPDHTRLRKLVNRAFTARVIERLRPRVEEIVARLLDACEDRGSIDVVADLAYPLPVTVICDLLGVPEPDRPAIRAWSLELIHTLDPTVAPEAFRRAMQAAVEFRDYLSGELIPARRDEPGEDLLSGLLAAEEEGERLTHDELLSTCVLLLVAGHETTSGLIGNGTLALLQHPDELGRLREDGGLIRSAVEELLRFDSPVQLTARLLLEDLAVDGTVIPAGAQAVGMIGAANRDPEQFEDPDRLDLGRQDNRNMAFGGGIHFCLGAPLARVEAQIAIGELTTRFPDLELGGEPEWRDTITLRGLTSLPVGLASKGAGAR